MIPSLRFSHGVPPTISAGTSIEPRRMEAIGTGTSEHDDLDFIVDAVRSALDDAR